MKQRIIPIVSVVVGLLAFALTWRYIQGITNDLKAERERIYAGAKKVVVVAAATDIPQGSAIAQSDVGTISIFQTAATDLEILPDDFDSIRGKKTLRAIKAKRPILWSDIEGGTPSSQGLAPIIKPGMRAVSLSVGGAAAVSGMVQPNDRVDILGTFTFAAKKVEAGRETEIVTLTVLQDVTVLATGQTLAKQQYSVRSGPRSQAATGYGTVTVEVTAREAELLVFAQQVQGRLTLSLRNPSDISFEKDLPEINFEHVEKKLPELNHFRQERIRKKPVF